ncbi:MAG: hypothetical protein K2N25_05555 [Muribaculaceae bacterium]|nr:hypothetical protein [Muribaculaceae bacterium]
MTIKTVPEIWLNKGQLQVLSKDGRWVNLHYRQGEIDGACAIYSVAFCMIYEQMIDSIDASGRKSGDRLLRELLDNYGLVRPGFRFKDLKAIIDRYKKKSWFVDYCPGTPKTCVEEICDKIDDGMTPIIGIDFPECTLGHALLAVGYEYEEVSGKVSKIFCLDPSAPSPRTAIWNSYVDVNDLRKPSIYVNNDPDYIPAKCRLTDYMILHDTDLDE